MANRTKFWHFNTSGGFYGELLSNTGLTDTPENRAQALVSTDNGCYHYIVFIKETDQIYTHGNLYDCSTFNGSEVKSLLTGLTSGEILDDDKAMTIIAKLHYLINQNAGNIAVLESEKADKSEVEILRANVEENAEVTAKALNDLNDSIIENEEITSAAISDLYDRVSGNSSGAVATLQKDLEELQAEVSDNETVTGAAINDLYSKIGSIVPEASGKQEVYVINLRGEIDAATAYNGLRSAYDAGVRSFVVMIPSIEIPVPGAVADNGESFQIIGAIGVAQDVVAMNVSATYILSAESIQQFGSSQNVLPITINISDDAATIHALLTIYVQMGGSVVTLIHEGVTTTANVFQFWGAFILSTIPTIVSYGSGGVTEYLCQYSNFTVTTEEISSWSMTRSLTHNNYDRIECSSDETSKKIASNTLYVWGEMSSLTIWDLNKSQQNDRIANEYLFQFTSGATATTLTMPSWLKWAEGLEDVVDGVFVPATNSRYQVSIVEDCAIYAKFPA